MRAILLALLLGGPAVAADEAVLDLGREVVCGRCARCHGVDEHGGIADIRGMKRSEVERALRSATQMPMMTLPEAEVTAVIASLAALEAGARP